MTKKMKQSLIKFVANVDEKTKDRVGSFYDLEEIETLCLINTTCAVAFEGLSKEEESEVIDACGLLKSGSKALLKMFQPLYDKNLYPDEYTEILNISEIQKEVTEAKKTIEWKKYNERKVMLHRKFNSLFNKILFLEAARCIDGKSVTLHYPTKNRQPIF